MTEGTGQRCQNIVNFYSYSFEYLYIWLPDNPIVMIGAERQAFQRRARCLQSTQLPGWQRTAGSLH